MERDRKALQWFGAKNSEIELQLNTQKAPAYAEAFCGVTGFAVKQFRRSPGVVLSGCQSLRSLGSRYQILLLNIQQSASGSDRGSSS